MSDHTVTIGDIATIIETFAPLALQEDYDNCGLQLGCATDEVTGILLCIDVTEASVQEAVSRGCNLIVSHHPVIFSGLKRIVGKTQTERIVVEAMKHQVALYAAHTNVDAVNNGVSHMMCRQLGLEDCTVLAPLQNQLLKLVTFVPNAHVAQVREAIATAGAGHIGNYDSCSFQVSGDGQFRALSDAHPFVGAVGELHTEPEIRLETIVPSHLSSQVVRALKKAHPYEEVAYDLYPLQNEWSTRGFGMVGTLPEAQSEDAFLLNVKQIFGCECVRHTPLTGKKVKKVAVCGGSGSSLIKKALAVEADVFITADLKYHQFFDADGRIVIADIGHFESEQFTKELFFELLTKKLPNFAIHLSNINSNPINYL